MAKLVGEKGEAPWGRKSSVAIDRQRQLGTLTSRLHLRCHTNLGPEAHYVCASSVWLASKGDHLITAEDWFVTSFPHRHLHGASEASRSCELVSALSKAYT